MWLWSVWCLLPFTRGKASFQCFRLRSTLFSTTGHCTGENVSIHYHASGVILNHNFTKAFYTQDTKDCEPCQNLTNNIRKGVSKRDHISSFISTPISNYHLKHFFFLFIGRELITCPANNCLQITVCSCVILSKLVLLQIIFCSYVMVHRYRKYSDFSVFQLLVSLINY